MKRFIVGLSIILAGCTHSPYVAVEQQGALILDRYQSYSVEEETLPHFVEYHNALSELSSKLRATVESALSNKQLGSLPLSQESHIRVLLTVRQTPVWDIFEYPLFVTYPNQQFEYYLAHGFHYEVRAVVVRMVDGSTGKTIWQADLATPLVDGDRKVADRLHEAFAKLL